MTASRLVSPTRPHCTRCLCPTPTPSTRSGSKKTTSPSRSTTRSVQRSSRISPTWPNSGRPWSRAASGGSSSPALTARRTTTSAGASCARTSSTSWSAASRGCTSPPSSQRSTATCPGTTRAASWTACSRASARRRRSVTAGPPRSRRPAVFGAPLPPAASPRTRCPPSSARAGCRSGTRASNPSDGRADLLAARAPPAGDQHGDRAGGRARHDARGEPHQPQPPVPAEVVDRPVALGGELVQDAVGVDGYGMAHALQQRPVVDRVGVRAAFAQVDALGGGELRDRLELGGPVQHGTEQAAGVGAVDQLRPGPQGAVHAEVGGDLFGEVARGGGDQVGEVAGGPVRIDHLAHLRVDPRADHLHDDVVADLDQVGLALALNEGERRLARRLHPALSLGAGQAKDELAGGEPQDVPKGVEAPTVQAPGEQVQAGPRQQGLVDVEERRPHRPRPAHADAAGPVSSRLAGLGPPRPSEPASPAPASPSAAWNHGSVRRMPSARLTCGFQPSRSWATAISGRRISGSSTGRGTKATAGSRPAARAICLASSSTVISSGLPRLTGPVVSDHSSRQSPSTRSST